MALDDPSEQGIDEKITTLGTYVKQKTDLIKEILRGKGDKNNQWLFKQSLLYFKLL